MDLPGNVKRKRPPQWTGDAWGWEHKESGCD